MIYHCVPKLHNPYQGPIRVDEVLMIIDIEGVLTRHLHLKLSRPFYNKDFYSGYLKGSGRKHLKGLLLGLPKGTDRWTTLIKWKTSRGISVHKINYKTQYVAGRVVSDRYSLESHYTKGEGNPNARGLTPIEVDPCMEVIQDMDSFKRHTAKDTVFGCDIVLREEELTNKPIKRSEYRSYRDLYDNRLPDLCNVVHLI